MILRRRVTAPETSGINGRRHSRAESNNWRPSAFNRLEFDRAAAQHDGDLYHPGVEFFGLCQELRTVRGAAARHQRRQPVVVYSNAWVTFDGILPNGIDSVSYNDATFAYWATAVMPVATGATMGRSGFAAVDVTQQDSVPFIGAVPTGFGTVTPGGALAGAYGSSHRATSMRPTVICSGLR